MFRLALHIYTSLFLSCIFSPKGHSTKMHQGCNLKSQLQRPLHHSSRSSLCVQYAKEIEPIDSFFPLLGKLHVSTLIVIGDVITKRMQPLLLNLLKPDSSVKEEQEGSYAKYCLCIINAPTPSFPLSPPTYIITHYPLQDGQLAPGCLFDL